MRDRDSARTEKDRNPCPSTWQAYRGLRNAVKSRLATARTAHFRDTFKSCKTTHWKDIRKYIVSATKPEPQPSSAGSTDSVWADRLNHYFASVGPDTAAALNTAADAGETVPPRPPRVCAGYFRVGPATLPELSAALNQLGGSRASGEDGVTVQQIRMTFPVIAPHLLHIVNNSLVSGLVPEAWKSAIVNPLFKGGDRSEPNNFRPISILSVIGKLCERVVGNQLLSYLNKHNIICAEQHGFRPGHSTESAMLCVVDKLVNNMDCGLISTLTTTDTSKAFDSVQHCRLLEKLGWYGIDDHWFRGWLADRTQRVAGCSMPLEVTHGVIQGSTLGPVLFSLFTNDLPSFVHHGQFVMYADDAQFIDADAPANVGDLRARVESTLETVLNWFTQNRLKINPSKTDLLVVKSRRLHFDETFQIRFGSQFIRPSPSVKVLGVVLDSCLNWEFQISAIVRRCYGILVGLAKLSHRLPRETKKVIIEGLVYPHIIYCLTVWGGCAKTQKHRIQKVLNFGARIITGLKRSQHISPALNELGWLKVEQLLSERDLLVLYRILHSPESPEHLRAMTVLRSAVSDRTTRGTDSMLLETPRVRTEFARRSFPCRAIATWNRLPPELRSTQSLRCFLTGIQSWVASDAG